MYIPPLLPKVATTLVSSFNTTYTTDYHSPAIPSPPQHQNSPLFLPSFITITPTPIVHQYGTPPTILLHHLVEWICGETISATLTLSAICTTSHHTTGT
jgi:hypothetical protein